MAFPIFEEFINTQTIKDLLSEREDSIVVVAEENTTLQEVYNQFLEYNLRCLPIYRLNNGVKNYIGYITLYNLIPEDILKELEGQYKDSDFDIDTIVDKLDYFERPVKTILKEINLELKVISLDNTIRELINILSKHNHHCLVKNEKDEYEIVSQYDLVKYLSNHLEKIDSELLDQQASDCAGIVVKKRLAHVEGRVPPEYFNDIKLPEFVTINFKQSALEAFLLMLKNRIECVAVTDDDGYIVTVLTSGNVRGLNPEALKEVVKPIFPFLKSALDDIPKPYTCTENYTIIQLIKKLLYYQTRRLIVVNKNEEPIGVVSMSDIVSSFNIEEITKTD